jgi:hypothetical protein
MTTQRSTCPNCGQKFEFPSEMLGQLYKCPTCWDLVPLESHIVPPVAPSKATVLANQIAAWILVVVGAAALLSSCISSMQPETPAQARQRAIEETQRAIDKVDSDNQKEYNWQHYGK